ncbi:ABC transporter permease [uncultured Subdoligranulum sp.]
MSRNKSNVGMVLRQKGSSVLAAILCILIGLAVGLIALFIINPEHAWDQGFMRIIQGGFYDFPYGVGRTLTNSAPLIMTGLSVAFAFKTGLFNIGAAGQYTLGAFGALYCALILHLPWYLCLLASALFGAVWGAIPGIFKAYLNINEVITSIMFNWIGLYMVNEIVYARGTGAMYDVKSTRTWKLVDTSPESVIPSAGMSELFHTPSTTIAIFLAIAAAVLIWVILEKTTFGYELKAVGLNKNAARYAGINEKKNIILSMTIAGALAGFGAGLLYLSGGAEWNPLNTTTLPAMGFNGIATALLAASHPIGTIFSSVFISHITVGGSFLPTRYFPPEIADLISGIIIYLCAFAMLFRGVIGRMLHADKDISDANAEPAPQAGKEAK